MRWDICRVFPLVLLVLRNAALTKGVSCNSASGKFSWIRSTSRNGVSQCYKGSAQTMTFAEAKDLCERQMSMHIVFFETLSEQDTVKTYGFSSEVWLGISQVNNKWYWTHFQSDTGTPALYTDWGSPPGPDTQGVVNFSGKWKDVSPNNNYKVICEWNSDWSTELSGFSPLAELVKTTTVAPTTILYTSEMTSAVDICQRPDSTYTYLRESSLRRLHNGVVQSLIRTEVRSAVSCAIHCFVTDSCCFIGYSPADKSCYRVIYLDITALETALNCSTIHCYSVGRLS